MELKGSSIGTGGFRSVKTNPVSQEQNDQPGSEPAMAAVAMGNGGNCGLTAPNLYPHSHAPVSQRLTLADTLDNISYRMNRARVSAAHHWYYCRCRMGQRSLGLLLELGP